MVAWILKKILGSKNQRELRRLAPLVRRINEFDEQFATLPLYLNALTARGAHLVTVNDYLARRDAEWMAQLYNFLGLTVGCIQHDEEPDARREQYAMDITYGTNSEFGFDYLRDN